MRWKTENRPLNLAIWKLSVTLLDGDSSESLIVEGVKARNCRLQVETFLLRSVAVEPGNGIVARRCVVKRSVFGTLMGLNQ